MKTHDRELGNASGAYALHALSPDETASFEEALAHDEELRAEVTGLTDTAVALGLSTAPEEPPVALRASILDAIAGLPQAAPLASTAEPAAAEPVASTPSSVREPGPAERRARARWIRRPAGILAVAAAAVVLIFGGGVAITAGVQTQQSIATASAITAIQSAHDFQRAATTVKGGGDATLIWSASQQRAAVIVQDLPQAASGRTYELWYIRDGRATAAGTFDPDASGSRSVVLTGALHAGATIGMTVEPAGGSAAPTTAPIVAVATSA